MFNLKREDSVLSYIKKGAPVTKEMEKKYTWHNKSSTEYGGEMSEREEEVTKSTLDETKLTTWAKKWSKKKQIYQTMDARPNDFSDFDAWATKIDTLMPQFETEIQKKPINNQGVVKEMKHEMSKMIDCI